MSVYVSHGTGDGHYEFIVDEASGYSSIGWTVNPNVEPGDTIVFYIKQPYSCFIAIGEVVSEVYRLNEPGHRWHNDWFAEIEIQEVIDPLHIHDLQEAFPDWGWPRMPQARVRVPEEYEEPFLALLRGKRNVDEDDDDELEYGAGFGQDYERNKEVEEAAVDGVWEWFEDNGWKVEDRQRDNCGYDLLCTKRNREAHVEVKGVSGDEVKFILTRKERDVAIRDPLYWLCIVTNALSDEPEHHDYLHDVIKEKFKFTPFSYRVELIDET